MVHGEGAKPQPHLELFHELVLLRLDAFNFVVMGLEPKILFFKGLHKLFLSNLFLREPLAFEFKLCNLSILLLFGGFLLLVTVLNLLKLRFKLF